MAENVAFAGLIFLSFFFVFIFGLMATSNAQLACPELASAQADSGDVVAWVFATAGILFSPCAGLPLWAYVLIFGPIGVAILVHVIPFVG